MPEPMKFSMYAEVPESSRINHHDLAEQLRDDAVRALGTEVVTVIGGNFAHPILTVVRHEGFPADESFARGVHEALRHATLTEPSEDWRSNPFRRPVVHNGTSLSPTPAYDAIQFVGDDISVDMNHNKKLEMFFISPEMRVTSEGILAGMAELLGGSDGVRALRARATKLMDSGLQPFKDSTQALGQVVDAAISEGINVSTISAAVLLDQRLVTED